MKRYYEVVLYASACVAVLAENEKEAACIAKEEYRGDYDNSDPVVLYEPSEIPDNEIGCYKQRLGEEGGAL